MNFGRKLEFCRMCNSRDLYEFLDLGFLPPADKILKKEDLYNHEIYFPLKVAQCQECGLTQLTYVVNPEILYGETYSYESSITETGRKHFFEMAYSIFNRFNLKNNDLIVDIGSNVGVLLEGFKKNGLRVLGIDPAPRIVDIANKKGIESWKSFMNKEISNKILVEKGKANIITATNVFAHVDNKKELIESVKDLLNEKGIFVIEAPYFLDLIENLEYDTIYLDHLEYLSVKPMVSYFQKNNLELFHVEKYKIHGSSLRYFISWKNNFKIQESVDYFLNLEKEKRIYKKETLDDFSRKVKEHKKEFLNLIHELIRLNKKIVGISAPAKGNTLLNYCKIHDFHLDYITEKSKLKIGHFTPGMHIPIIEEENLLKDNIDYGIIFAWNFAEEIINNNEEFLKKGGKFIIPIPELKIIDRIKNNNSFNNIREYHDMGLFGVKIRKIDPIFMDERGIISDLINEPINNVGLISTEKDAVRGCHYHKKSKQYSYILSGKFEVLLAPFNKLSNIKKVIVNAGELITIPSLVIHQFTALERSVMINMESQSRAESGYENDTIRVKLEVEN